MSNQREGRKKGWIFHSGEKGYKRTSTTSVMYAAKMLHAGYNNAILISIKSSRPATFPYNNP